MKDTNGFRKSSYSNLECVEAMPAQDGTIVVRNSRHPESHVPPFTKNEWAAFVSGVKDGEFDLARTGEFRAVRRPAM